MTKTAISKTFYARTFEYILRYYFKCPSKTTFTKPIAYMFLPNKDNKTGYFRTKENGWSDVILRSWEEGDVTTDKFLTFFPYVDETGKFSIDKKYWNNFINGINKSKEVNIYGVFCINKNSFILASNQSEFTLKESTVHAGEYTFEAYAVTVHNGTLFERSPDDARNWIVTRNGSPVIITYDEQYRGILEDRAFCCPLPRIGKSHLIFNNSTYGVNTTFTDFANKYHGEEVVDSFIRKLRRNLVTNTKQVDKGLRMKPIEGTKIIVVPDDFDEYDFVEWQKSHMVKKTDNKEYMTEYMRKYRKK